MDKLPSQVQQEFKAKSKLRGDSNPTIQVLEAGATSFEIDGSQVPLDNKDLVPAIILSKGFKYLVDNEERFFVPTVFRSKVDSSVLIVKNMDGRLKWASKKGQNKDSITVLAVQDDVYASISSDELDDDAVAHISLENIVPSSTRRQLRKEDRRPESMRGRRRDLQAGCSSYDIITVTIHVDSFMCHNEGGADGATTEAMGILTKASEYFEELCIKLDLKKLHVYCTAASDPIRPFYNKTGTKDVCDVGSPNSLLQQFSNFVGTSGGVSAAEHLFYGYQFPDPDAVVGCAWVSTLCRTDGTQTGVNEMTLSNIDLKAKLFAHELGHNFNAMHDGSNTDIMYSPLCGGSNCNKEFGPTSGAAIEAMVNSVSCLSQESESPTIPATIPAPAPIPPTPACQDNEYVYFSDNNGKYWYCNTLAPQDIVWACSFDLMSFYCPNTCNTCADQHWDA
ncbi:hypothetical protein ACA910_004305 [Epithemia clementina (nom. ined.)]